MCYHKKKNGFSLLNLIIGIIVVFIILNILFSIFSAIRPIIWPGYGYYHRGYWGRTYYGHRSPYGKYPPGPVNKGSSFGDRFASKKGSSSFASRFSSKYGRSRVSGFRSSGFFGGK